MRKTARRAAIIGGGLIGGAVLAEIGLYATAWYRYGRRNGSLDDDPLLLRFMPEYEVAERHDVQVAAPAEITYAAACSVDLGRSRLVRAIFRGRELLMTGRHEEAEIDTPSMRLRDLEEMGWGVLAEEPGHELVMGAVTQPWRKNVAFEPLEPDEFATFDEPGYARIVWTLKAERLGPYESLFRTETRAATTDAESRRRFRRYWSLFSPGIRLIRRAMLPMVKQAAEQRYQLALSR